MAFTEWLIRKTSRRHYDFAIGGDENPYCLRWWIIPRNRFFNIYLHKFLKDDEDRALHTHPWLNCSIPLVNGYVEQQFVGRWREGWSLPLTKRIERKVGSITFRLPSTPHRVILNLDGDGRPVPCWSLFFTGPVWREWGFVCPGGRFVHWKIFTDPTDYGRVGRGCGK